MRKNRRASSSPAVKAHALKHSRLAARNRQARGWLAPQGSVFGGLLAVLLAAFLRLLLLGFVAFARLGFACAGGCGALGVFGRLGLGMGLLALGALTRLGIAVYALLYRHPGRWCARHGAGCGVLRSPLFFLDRTQALCRALAPLGITDGLLLAAQARLRLAVACPHLGQAILDGKALVARGFGCLPLLRQGLALAGDARTRLRTLRMKG